MPNLTLRLYEDLLPAACPPVYLPACPRSLYVRHGELTAEGPEDGQCVREGEARVAQSAVALHNGRGDTVLWRWELTDDAAPVSDGLPSAPFARSELKLESALVLDDRFEWLMRCDRVDFPKGGVALTHVHQGPGIRICLHGQITIDTLGHRHDYAAGEAWFELGHAPVLAPTTESEETAFVRCFLLPRQLKGRSSIRYVRPEDAAAQKVQQYKVFAERYIDLGRSTGSVG
ncbi:hypothetical protein CSC74_10190 [Pseudoxanthomonas yeongjuensis]|uniref:hypothetical protein n=1 Tax=Pseudoxanthomonas yeongjuensis TaxID=377616 RepID=UPI001391AE05|nr:hypothetical protein [Pseudoxanthomonas yeongjuensis]KAF1716214.1 hypothetical protein CSC74_10190 [Pseudoxanthomonas yeongjuensis]